MPRALPPWIAFSLCVTAASVATAATVQDFEAEGAGTPFTTNAPGDHPACDVIPAEVVADPRGSVLRLAAAGSRNCDGIAFDLTDPGAHARVEASFSFRIRPPAGELPADGLGFTLLATSAFGTTGNVVGDAEEPGFASSLGIGFDVYDNFADGGFPADEVEGGGHHVSVHWDETFVAAAPVPFPLSTAEEFLDVDVVVDAGTVSGVVTPPRGAPTPVFNSLAVPGLVPYEARALFTARSGGLTADHDLDDVEVTFGGGDPDHPGAWSDTVPMDSVSIHLVLLPSTGELLFWGRYEDELGWWGQLYILDPVTLESREAAQPGYDAFCVGHSQLADGRILLTGGHLGPEPLIGLPNTSIYDPWLDEFIEMPLLNAGRWYPTNTLLANGDTLVVSGSVDTVVTSNPLPQVFEAATMTYRDLVDAVRPLPLYPWNYLAPDGRVFSAGPQDTAAYLDPTGTGEWEDVAESIWGDRDSGTSVMYEHGKIAVFGGLRFHPERETTASVELIDLGDPAPAFRESTPMGHPRHHVNSTLLPDGTVLITGGTRAPEFNPDTDTVFEVELWDPATETFREVAPMATPRLYHSTALLLPDGRVLSSGGGWPGEGTYANLEFYRPGYLFRGARPTITSAPERVTYGDTFTVETPDAAAIDDVVWMRVSSVTHSFNPDQRRVPLDFTVEGESLRVTAPPDSIVAPLGWWMLFLLDDGVPSESLMMRTNRAPIAGDDALAGTEEVVVTGVTDTLLANDSDPDGDVLTLEVAVPPEDGVVDLAAGTYTPARDAYGTRTFTYRALDGAAATEATVTVTLEGREDPPIAVDDAVEAEVGVMFVIDVLANDIEPDGQPLTIVSLTPSDHATARIDSGTVVYSLDDEVPEDSFEYEISDGTFTAGATVTITSDAGCGCAASVGGTRPGGNLLAYALLVLGVRRRRTRAKA